jgi:hypothetical protein
MLTGVAGLVAKEGNQVSPASRFLDRPFRGLNRYGNRVNLRRSLEVRQTYIVNRLCPRIAALAS